MKVNDIKKKVAAKVAKGKAKVAAKCGTKTKKLAAVVALFAFAAIMDGCLYPTAPSRSQNLTIRDCNITLYGGGAETGDVARVEIASQAMAIETNGTENNTNTPTQTTDVKPDIDTTVGGMGGGGVLDKALATGVNALCGDSCPDGNCSASCASGGACSPCSDGSCTDGACSVR